MRPTRAVQHQLRRGRPARAIWFVAALSVSACSDPADSSGPVAIPTLEVSTDRAPIGSPVEATFRFAVLPDAAVDQDYRVFVHFVDEANELMWAADHEPPIPTRQWAPGETIEYTRTILVPMYPSFGEASIEVGLYSVETQTRLWLDGDDAGQRSYRVGTLRLLPPSEELFVTYGAGWHPVEFDPSGVQWRWSRKTGTISFPNPGRDSFFYLHLGGVEEFVDDPRTLTALIGDEPVDRFEIPPGDNVWKLSLNTSVLGSEEMVDLTLVTDPTFVPNLTDAGSADSRELGVRLFGAYVVPQ